MSIIKNTYSTWVGTIPWRRKWQSTQVLLPGKSHGQRSLVGYSPWGRKESDTTERLHFTSLHFTSGSLSTCTLFQSVIGFPAESNSGEPSLYAVLETPSTSCQAPPPAFQEFPKVQELVSSPRTLHGISGPGLSKAQVFQPRLFID